MTKIFAMSCNMEPGHRKLDKWQNSVFFTKCTLDYEPLFGKGAEIEPTPNAVNGILTSHNDNLSTHHYHLAYHPCFDTQFRHNQTMQQYFSAVSTDQINQSINKLYLNVERPPSQGEISLTNMGTF